MNSESFKWSEKCDSLCDAPVNPLDASDLDRNHPALVFLKYWEKIGDGGLPDRADFAPMDVPSVLKWFMLFRREMDGDVDNYHLFLQGSSAAEMTHGLLQGQYLHEFTSSYCYETRRDLMRAVLEAEKPLYGRIEISTQGEYEVDVTVGMFPLSEGDQKLVFVVPAPISLELRSLI
ncbi:MAG: PAS domain-containing protein [Kordiimonadaceae bacterium]|nr:PAS domain-containing protein [Kordiimonadaceae bacterium]